ncbi:hypothetical protein K437DRAFT_227433 [Tilletiaria anomala UBC 951]|uniref:Fatty acid hydroxylase domain-containing protein n=1 Tax=Tilletiaria anomala (strain ATCC 24038 / CBS 436.72 / UBC 951) TaxID=1037660 RepID=A0A066VNB1_TILAU|nr:uncharacterized protein K437DRAFT_227433 [Tilletiaria anomala UBC 951]KDN40249.1 hypothetical protein K437DRAFT_227433 [Tilletiaria anomala UBC 951]
MPSSDPLATLDLAPKQPSYPWYFAERPSLVHGISDKYLSLILPIICYWGLSTVYHFLDEWQHPFFEKYRIHEPEEVTKRNKVSKTRVVAMVLVQQLIQTALGIFVLEDDEVVHKQVFADHKAHIRSIGVSLARVVVNIFGMKQGMQMLTAFGTGVGEWIYWWGVPIAQFALALIVMDTWQYFWHRAFHQSRFLYRNFHSHHHRLYVPYAFGALYNHPLEGLLLDSLGAVVSHTLSFMTVRQGILLFAFSTLKTVDDHGGYAFPWWIDPLHLVFPNTAAYHNVHHEMQGLRYNFSQPYFIVWDKWCGSQMNPEKFKELKAQRARKSQAYQKSDDKVAGTGAGECQSSAVSAGAQASIAFDGLRKRDVAPKEIVDAVRDPFVTTDPGEHHAKAGTNAPS